MKYGILKTGINTGADSEVVCGFVAPLSVISNQPSYVQDSLNLSRRASSQNVQRWEIETNLEPSNDSSNFLVHSVLNGHDSVFFVRMPQVANLKCTDLSSARVASAAVMRASVITLNVAVDLKVGEYIQFEGHTKVYLVTEYAKLTGTTSLSIFPALHKPVSKDERIYSGDLVTMRARYDSSVRLGITYTDGVLSDPGSVKLIEAL